MAVEEADDPEDEDINQRDVRDDYAPMESVKV